MLEFYTAYADARDQMALTEELIASAAREILGTTELPWGEETISLKAPFRRISMVDAILEHAAERFAVTRETLSDLHLLRKTAERFGVESVERFGDSKGKLLAEIFGAVAEKKLVQPTYVVDYPAEISPLSKTKPDDPGVADRFELYVGRMEVANGFCELNDPDEQAEKFRAQVAERRRGDDEAMLFDEDYVEALSYGMPPTAGEGIGIDRLAMLFTNSPLHPRRHPLPAHAAEGVIALLLARRYLLASRKEAQVGVVALAAFLGVTLGVAALVVSLALLAGFQTHIRSRLLAETPHLTVTPAGRDAFTPADGLPEKIAALPGVVSVSPVARGRIWISVSGRTAPAKAVGRAGTKGLVLDLTQARPLGAVAGDEATLVSSRTRLSPLGPVPIVVSMTVERVIPASTGRREPEAVLPLDAARRLFALPPGGASAYEVFLSDPRRAAGRRRASRRPSAEGSP